MYSAVGAKDVPMLGNFCPTGNWTHWWMSVSIDMHFGMPWNQQLGSCQGLNFVAMIILEPHALHTLHTLAPSSAPCTWVSQEYRKPCSWSVVGALPSVGCPQESKDHSALPVLLGNLFTSSQPCCERSGWKRSGNGRASAWTLPGRSNGHRFPVAHRPDSDGSMESCLYTLM